MLLLMGLLLVPHESFAASGITYHGRILRPDGVTPVTSATTQFRIQVRTPGNCILWEEQQTKNLTASRGAFEITIADTTEPSLIANILPYTLERVFSNRTAFTGLSGCTSGTSFTPNPTDNRLLVVFFREVPSDPWEQMPIVQINSIPLALNSVQLAGYDASEFLKVDSTSSYTPLTASQVNTLMDIIAGTNTQYLRPSTTFSGDVSGAYNTTSVDKIKGVNVSSTAPTNGQVLKLVGGVWTPAADDNTGTTPGDASYSAKGVVQVDTNLATSGLSISSGVLAMPNVITAGGPTGGAQTVPVITYDQKGRLTAVTTATIDDNTKLPLAGGTMTGAINMGTQNITNATSVAATNISTRNVILADNDTDTITIRAPTDVTTTYNFTLPATPGTSGHVLSTDGAGTLSWVAQSGGGGAGAYFVDGGNTFGAAATFGTNDNFDLNLETNGTTKMAIDGTGKIGIGRAPATNTKVAIQGTVAGTTNIIATGAAVDLSLSNLHLLKAPGTSAIALSNLTDGGVYTIYISDTTQRTYTFTGCGTTYYNPANADTTFRSSYTIAAIYDSGSYTCFITWSTGYN